MLLRKIVEMNLGLLVVILCVFIFRWSQQTPLEPFPIEQKGYMDHAAIADQRNETIPSTPAPGLVLLVNKSNNTVLHEHANKSRAAPFVLVYGRNNTTRSRYSNQSRTTPSVLVNATARNHVQCIRSKPRATSQPLNNNGAYSCPVRVIPDFVTFSNEELENQFCSACTVSLRPAIRPVVHDSVNCTRYLVGEEAGFGAGLGHRFGAVVFAAALADEFGFTLVISDEIWNAGSIHDSYRHIKDMMGLSKVLSLSDVVRVPGLKMLSVSSREDFLQKYALEFKDQCNILVKTNLANSESCRSLDGTHNTWCFVSWPGAYQRARHLLQNRNPSARQQPLFANYSSLIVAWHLRCGDITLHKDDSLFFENINSIFNASPVDVQHFFFSKRCDGQFDFLRKIYPSAVFVDTDLGSTIQHLQAADVLIHTGSSLAAAAAVSAPSTQLYFQSPPKEMQAAVQTYGLLSAISIDSRGLLLGLQQKTVSQVLQVLALRKRRLQIPPPLMAATARMAAFLVSSSLRTQSDIDGWSDYALLLERCLPWVSVRLHYDSCVLGICSLRARSNVQLVVVYGR